MTKKIFSLLLLFFSLMVSAQDSTYRISVFFNKGQAIPLGKFRGEGYPMYPSETERSMGFLKSFNWGLDLYFFDRLGLVLGISSSGFSPDKITFEKMHLNNLEFADSYLQDAYIHKIYGGITSKFKYLKLRIEPRFIFGYSTIKMGIADFYEKKSEGNIYRTINYNMGIAGSVFYGGALNINYPILHYKHLVIGLQVYTEYLRHNAHFTISRNESNRITKVINKSEIQYNQKMSEFYYGFGLILTTF